MNSCQILSIDGKDLYGANIIGNDYTVKYSDGSTNFRKYINTLDDSLELRKVREIYCKIFKKNDFSFRDKNNLSDKEYTNHVINVTFNYSYKLYNKFNKNLYVKDGYDIKKIALEDSICIVNGEIAAIKTNEPVSCNRLPDYGVKYFKYNEETKMYEQTGSIKTLKSVGDIRNYLYKNGFILDGIKYVRYKRSSGSSRVGKCLFINEKLYKAVQKWSYCGLNVKYGGDIDLASFEAAVSLPLSSIIGTVEIHPQNILLIDDYDSEFVDEAAAVTMNNNELAVKPGKIKIKNSIWDGQSLLDNSIFEEFFGVNKSKGMLLLRNRFFKTCGFNTNIQRFFSDNGITEISQLNGKTLASDISQIKLITTPNSIKYLKFGTFEQWLENIDSIFGVVKFDKPTYYFSGRMVQTHYQLLNTLQLNRDEIKTLLKPSMDYIDSIKKEPAVLRYHINHTYQDPAGMDFTCKDDVVYGLLVANEKFCKTRLYQDYKNKLVESLTKNLKRGHVLVNGTYATMLGNPIEMLNASIGYFYGESSLGIGNIYSKRFKDGDEILGTRSPHIVSGNIYIAKNRKIPEIDRYFNLTKEIVCVNSINENLQQRCNGCDFDSDSLLITDNSLLIKKAKLNYCKFNVPTSLIDAEKTKRTYTLEECADLDIKTSNNKIGEIVNLSQELNSLLWHRVNSGEPINANTDLYCDICKLAVLSGIEIDKAKKEYLVNSGKEIKKLKEKYSVKNKSGIKIKPMFFKMITLDNGYSLNPKIKYEYRDTPMDYLQKTVSDWGRSSMGSYTDKYTLPLSSVICINGEDRKYGKYYNTAMKTVETLRNFKNEIRANSENKIKNREFILDIVERREKYINSTVIGKRVASILLKMIDDKEYSDIKWRLFSLLFYNRSKAGVQIIKSNGVNRLIECKNGDIRLYDFNFVIDRTKVK